MYSSIGRSIVLALLTTATLIASEHVAPSSIRQSTPEASSTTGTCPKTTPNPQGLLEGPRETALPEPARSNLQYGPHEQNVLDLWLPHRADGVSPVVVYIHGGGFMGGDKRKLAPKLVKACLEKKIAFASINYRFVTSDPFPAPFLDGARAIQYLRHLSEELRLDPTRIAVSGDSAGGGISMWVAFHDDLADPSSPDLVARQSSRVSCVFAVAAQSSYDPRVMTSWVGEIVLEHPAMKLAYGVDSVEELVNPNSELAAAFETCSPITHLSTDDPPIVLFYGQKGTATLGEAVHNIVFGQKLRDAANRCGVNVLLNPGQEEESLWDVMVRLLAVNLGMNNP